jgi:hypothetical protein
VVHTRCGPGGGTSGGKSRRHAPGAGLESEARGYVSLQAQLVTLDREQVVAALLDDLRTQVTLAKHRVAEDDPALDRQDARQFQGRLVLVRLGINPDLGEDGLMLVRVGGDQVLAGRLAIAAAAECLTVEGDGLLFVLLDGWQAGNNPSGEGRLERGRVEATEEVREARGGWCLTAEESQSVGQFDAVVAAELGDGSGALAATEHGQYGQRE